MVRVTEPLHRKVRGRAGRLRRRPCIEFEGRWYSGNEITAYADAIAAVLREAGVADDAPVGLVVRNRLPHAAAIMGFIAAGRAVSMIYSFQSPESIGRDIETLGLSAVVADERGLDRRGHRGRQACRQRGRRPLDAGARRRACRRAGAPRRDPRHAEAEPGVALQILTSGTTGPPKRQSIKTRVLERTVFSVTSGEAAPPGAPPEFSYWQFGGIGVCQLIAGAYNGRRIVILERFSIDGWVDAVKTHGIKRSGVQPAVIRMLLDADVPKEDLASLEFLISASGPLDPETRDEFEARYGIPVKLAYGATEFAGSLCAWTPDMDREFGASKRNSVGRALPDTAAAHRRPGHRRRACHRRAGAAGGQGRLDQRRLDPHHRHRLDRRRRVRHTARQGRWRHQPRRVQGPAGNRSPSADLTSRGA